MMIRSGPGDAGCLKPFGALFHFEGHFLAFLKRAKSSRGNRREMDEYILTAIFGCDEAEPLGVVEPLYGTCTHCFRAPTTVNRMRAFDPLLAEAGCETALAARIPPS